jgi:hypothetical protein
MKCESSINNVMEREMAGLYDNLEGMADIMQSNFDQVN